MEEINLEDSEQKEGEKKKSTAWLVFLALIIVLGIVLIFVFSDRVAPEPEPEFEYVQGSVVYIDQVRKSFFVSASLLEKDEDGKPNIIDITYSLTWQKEDEILPHHPGLLQGGERVKVWVKEAMTSGKTNYSVQKMEILRGPDL